IVTASCCLAGAEARTQQRWVISLRRMMCGLTHTAICTSAKWSCLLVGIAGWCRRRAMRCKNLFTSARLAMPKGVLHLELTPSPQASLRACGVRIPRRLEDLLADFGGHERKATPIKRSWVGSHAMNPHYRIEDTSEIFSPALL